MENVLGPTMWFLRVRNDGVSGIKETIEEVTYPRKKIDSEGQYHDASLIDAVSDTCAFFNRRTFSVPHYELSEQLIKG